MLEASPVEWVAEEWFRVEAGKAKAERGEGPATGNNRTAARGEKEGKVKDSVV